MNAQAAAIARLFDLTVCSVSLFGPMPEELGTGDVTV
jgi:hypothetical protein